MTDERPERCLRVYEDRSVLVRLDGTEEVFAEGLQSEAAQERNQNLKAGIGDFLRARIAEAVSDEPPGRELNEAGRGLIDAMIGGVTSERGRAVLALAVAQAATKSMEPDQSIRLHKGNRTRTFGWVEGVGLRDISRIVAVVLRESDLLRLNASGPMMTRTLAENYPYTGVYKAAIRGPKSEWLELVDAVEFGALDSDAVLEYLLLRLSQESEAFLAAADMLLEALEAFVGEDTPTFDEVSELILKHVAESTHSARLFEVAMHSLAQAVDEAGGLDGELRPLVQMRTADLKAGKVADIEIGDFADAELIVEAWDAKYGRPYLVDEVYELATKLEGHPEVTRVGFVVDRDPVLDEDVLEAMQEIEDAFDIQPEVLTFEGWGQTVTDGLDRERLATPWLDAYAESLALRRRDRAPIDEPTADWVRALTVLL